MNVVQEWGQGWTWSATTSTISISWMCHRRAESEGSVRVSKANISAEWFSLKTAEFGSWKLPFALLAWKRGILTAATSPVKNFGEFLLETVWATALFGEMIIARFEEKICWTVWFCIGTETMVVRGLKVCRNRLISRLNQQILTESWSWEDRSVIKEQTGSWNSLMSAGRQEKGGKSSPQGSSDLKLRSVSGWHPKSAFF